MRVTRRNMAGVITVAAAAVGLTVPAAASAGYKDVKQHLKQARVHVDKVESLVDTGRDRRATALMDAANVQVKRARGDARGIDGVNGARGLKKAAAQFDRQLEVFTEVIGEMRGRTQDEVAAEIVEAVNGREKALEVLAGLIPGLWDKAQIALTKSMSRISADDPATVEELGTLIAGGEIAARAVPEAEDALAALTAAFADVVERLEGLVAELPAEAQPYVTDAIALLTAQFAQVVQTLSDLFAGLPSELPIDIGGLPIPIGS